MKLHKYLIIMVDKDKENITTELIVCFAKRKDAEHYMDNLHRNIENVFYKKHNQLVINNGENSTTYYFLIKIDYKEVIR